MASITVHVEQRLLVLAASPLSTHYLWKDTHNIITMIISKVWKCRRGNLLIRSCKQPEERQTTQGPKEKIQKDKQVDQVFGTVPMLWYV